MTKTNEQTNAARETGRKYYVSEYRKDKGVTWYVCAPPGFYLGSDGKLHSDGCVKGGPEWTTEPSKRMVFKSHRAAARVRNKCISAKVCEAF